eukprot:CFRG5815T1
MQALITKLSSTVIRPLARQNTTAAISPVNASRTQKGFGKEPSIAFVVTGVVLTNFLVNQCVLNNYIVSEYAQRESDNSVRTRFQSATDCLH